MDGMVYYGVVNNIADEESKLGSKYTVPQIAFYKGLLEAIAHEAGNDGSITNIDALNIRIDNQKFQQEDKKLSNTEAYMRRSETQRKADQKAREESERLRQQEREQVAEKRRRDMTLRARVAAKAEEKRLELLYIQWVEHHKKLSNFLRTKAEPPIYYMLAKSIIDDPAIVEQNKEKVFEEWKSVRRAELTQFQKKVEEQYMSNVERQLERLQNARNARRGNGLANMQEMDKELDTHRAEHGPKTRRIPEGGNDDEDVEDIAAEDELIDEVLGVNEAINEDPTKPSEEATDGVPVREVAQ